MSKLLQNYSQYSFSIIFCAILLQHNVSFAQPKTIVKDSSNSTKVLVIAGEYQRSSLHNTFFGKNYRDIWSTPVNAPIVLLDTIYGGLTPYKSGGGRQSKSLHLHDKANREYVLRSINKSFGRALPSMYRGTFIEDGVNDQVTFDHPYAALTIAALADATGVLHTTPKMVYIPQQPTLDTFNADFSNYLYLLEQRPDENWETEENFGNAKKIIGTDKMLEKLQKDNNNSVDQVLYVRSRLFDMLIGDWGRHEDQWRWAVIEENGRKIYKPIPRDRDHAYARFGGILPKLLIGAAGIDYLSSYADDIKDIRIYNYTARYLDRRCTNELTQQQWTDIAKKTQAQLTDEIIEQAVKQLPPEVYALSGKQLIDILRTRRNHLIEFANRYYAFISQHVDIPGTEAREYFEVNRVNDNETRVCIYKIDKNGKVEDAPLYSRLFKTSETKDIRLYGIAGKDKFHVAGDVHKGLKISIVGGADADSMIDESRIAGWSKKTHIYDDKNNTINTGMESRLFNVHDSAGHAYNYKEFQYSGPGMQPIFIYKNPDKLFAGIGYGYKHHSWRKYPYGWQQGLFLLYSVSENTWKLAYNGTLYQFAGRWDMGINISYDLLRTTNFYGIGNETIATSSNNSYNRLRLKELTGQIAFSRHIHHHYVSFGTFANFIQLNNEPNNLVTDKYLAGHPDLLDQKFIGLNANYTYQDIDNNTIPEKGAMIYGGISCNRNIYAPKQYVDIKVIAQLYIPLINKFSLSTRTGFSGVFGEPEFYQYTTIGGCMNFRGYVRDRFRGNIALYNSNELRYVCGVRSYLVNGKAGLIALFDNGRVWLNGENSTAWHYAYGGGILFVPFHKFMFTTTYAHSVDGGIVQLRFNQMLGK